MYFLALLVQALIERELRGAMKRRQLKSLPIYPEERRCPRPTTEQILRLFAHAQRHTLMRDALVVQTFEADLTPRQQQVLELLGVPQRAFRS